MKRASLWTVLVGFCAFGIAGCGCNSHPKVTITTAPTTLAAGASSNVVAHVTHDSKNEGVDWSCAPAGACGTFTPSQTPSDTASSYTAPATAPSGGSVTITATSVKDPKESASATITITGVSTQNFVFYASGEENNPLAEATDAYSIAGVVAIATAASDDGSFAVVTGEQDYNDGDGNTSPSTGDTITGGSLVVSATGNAILTLTTSNTSLPNGGTEIFALAYANNPKHALIVEFDGSTTSSGSLDLQTSTTAPVSASFAFAVSGADSGFNPIAFGGVIAIDVSGNVTGVFDENDNGGVTLKTTIPAGGTVGATDSFGRGVATNVTGSDTSVNYYVVGAEVIRLINVNPHATAVGSAYSQGTTAGNFSSGSIGQSVFSIGNALDFYGAVGQFTTSAEAADVRPASGPVRQQATACTGTGTCLFNGVGDLNDLVHAHQLLANPISGNYTINANGYGSLAFNDSFDTVETFGVYAVDPNLNILDPNNTTDGKGGALIAEMDSNLVGTGSIVPQTATGQSVFTGSYAFGGQGDTTEGDEFDFVGVGAATEGDSNNLLAGAGALSDPFDALGADVQSTNATFNANLQADITNAGRFSGTLAIATTDVPPFGPVTLAVTAYQAYGGQLFWLETDPTGYFLGSLELVPGTQGTARKAQAKAIKPKH
jgi:hypothetical protein